MGMESMAGGGGMAFGPDQWTAITQAGAGTVNGVANIWGGNLAAKAQKKAQRKARTDLTKGYAEGEGFQQPIYDTGLGNYQGLSGGFASGKYDIAKMDPYAFDPNSVFQDPEFQASMKAGTQALDASANAGSNLFSGAHQRDLQEFGQDTFAQRSDALYDRGFNATNTAFNQNLIGSGQNFNQGLALTTPLGTAAGKLTDLSVMEGQDLANNSVGSGVIRANNINNTTTGLTDINSNLANSANSYFGGQKVQQPMSSKK
jgi:hypothetical protein